MLCNLSTSGNWVPALPIRPCRGGRLLGGAQGPQPWAVQVVSRAKWDEWSELKGMSQVLTAPALTRTPATSRLRFVLAQPRHQSRGLPGESMKRCTFRGSHFGWIEEV